MKKIAILFGNNEYQLEKNKLKNAVNDARSLEKELKLLGFDCECYTDTKSNEMVKGISRFKELLDDYDVALFFFAGHGVQLKGENYLASIDTSFSDEYSFLGTSNRLNDIIDLLEESKVRTKILMLDACRNNPFDNGYRGNMTVGLAPIRAPRGTIVAYSTSPGQVASDGFGSNGSYTSALLKHIGTPKITIEELFKRVRNTLYIITNGKQISWEHTSLMGDFYFNNGYIEGNYISNYHINTIKDKNFIFEKNSDLSQIVFELRSYDWYIQNPAINKISRLEMSDYTRDEIFILGRNIYQAACGSSNSAEIWINSIDRKLSNYEDEISFNILNGILFEIYFNSDGKLRSRFKTNKFLFEKILNLSQNVKYNRSFEFINSYLKNYSQEVINMPGTVNKLGLDIKIECIDNEKYYLDQIYLDGNSIMYDEDGKELYEYLEYPYKPRKMSIESFEDEIRELTVSRKQDIEFTYNYNESEATEYILVPYYFKLLRYSK